MEAEFHQDTSLIEGRRGTSRKGLSKRYVPTSKTSGSAEEEEEE